MSKGTLSTHILDTSCGKPGAGIEVHLYRQDGNDWKLIHKGITNEVGRYANFCDTESLLLDVYKLKFDVGAYYKDKKVGTLYPYVEVVFKTEENCHYHIPLLINPFGYSTYRGT